MKKQIGMLLIALLVGILGFIASTISASATEQGGITCTFDAASGKLTVSGQGEMTNGSEYPWKQYASAIRSVEISEGIQTIGPNAFYECSNLESVTFPNSLTFILDYAFYGCTKLKSVRIPGNVTNLGAAVFYGCTGLTDVTFSEGLQGIGYSSFQGCTGLTKVDFPDSLVAIGTFVFYGCTGLTNITIPDHVTNIGREAFGGGLNLKSVVIPDSVWMLMDVFKDCPAQMEIRFYSTATYERLKNQLTSTWIVTVCCKNNAHADGSWTKQDDDTHIRTCPTCSTTETQSHTWDSGKVTKQATCTEAGIKSFTCTACSATRTEEIATHSYGTAWQSDANSHYHVCTVCGDKKDSAPHSPGAAATETTPQTCTTCGYIITPPIGHTHVWATEWTTDESGHWYVCSGCSEKKDVGAHDFENECDTDCSICGFTRTTEHQFEMKHDETSHWQECKVCGETKDKEAHVAGPEATEENAQVCQACGYEIAPKLELEIAESETEDETMSADAPLEGENQGETKEGAESTKENAPDRNDAENGANSGSPLPWILGGFGLAAVISALGFFLLKKKK